MTRDDKRLVCRCREIGVGRRDHSVNAAAGRIVDEWIDAVPVSVGNMNDVRFGKGDRDVAVGMGRSIVFQSEPHRAG